MVVAIRVFGPIQDTLMNPRFSNFIVPMSYFLAKGQWADASIHCDANGWPTKNDWKNWYLAPGIAFNRLRFHRYFLLCGNLAKQEPTNFAIGVQRTIQIRDDKYGEGPIELFLFANDIPSKYDNNQTLGKDYDGPMQVSIQRKK